MLGGPPGEPGGVGRPFLRARRGREDWEWWGETGVVRRPSRRNGKGQEVLTESRGELGVSPECLEGLGGPPGGQGGIERDGRVRSPSGRSGRIRRPSRRAGRGQEGQAWLGVPLAGAGEVSRLS